MGLSAWAFWHRASEGAFTELVKLQLSRSGQGDLVETMRELPGLATFLADMSGAGFSWRLYRAAFGALPGDPMHLDLLLVVGAGAGLVVLWRHREIPLAMKATWSGWIAFPLLFSFLVWPLAYEHYHVLYLPALAFLCCLWLQHAVVGRRGPVLCVGVLTTLWLLAGLFASAQRMRDYAPVLALRGDETPLLAFDPTVNVLSGAPVACGATHWLLPPYGDHSHGAPYLEGRDHLIDCLRRSSEVRVALHTLSPISLVLIDRVLYAELERLGPQRLLYLSEDVRPVLNALHRAPR